jgi:hypothetical protein
VFCCLQWFETITNNRKKKIHSIWKENHTLDEPMVQKMKELKEK